MAPHEAHVSFAIAKVGSFSETTKFLPCFLVCFALFGSHFILSTWFCDEKALRSDPDGIQTHDLQNRNLTLYSAKLRSLVRCKNTAFLRLDQTILLFHPFALHWLWRFRTCACNTLDLLDLRSELPTKNSHVFRKISHVFWKISHVFCQTSEINLRSTSLSFSMLVWQQPPTTANRDLWINLKIPFSRVRVRAPTEILHFLLSQPSQISLQLPHPQRETRFFWTKFNI